MKIHDKNFSLKCLINEMPVGFMSMACPNRIVASYHLDQFCKSMICWGNFRTDYYDDMW